MAPGLARKASEMVVGPRDGSREDPLVLHNFGSVSYLVQLVSAEVCLLFQHAQLVLRDRTMVARGIVACMQGAAAHKS